MQKDYLIDFGDIYTPHENQRKVHMDEHRYRVVNAGRRWGKTAMVLNEGLAWIMDADRPSQQVWIILPEYKQAKNIYWVDPDIVKYYIPYVQEGILKKNDQEMSLYCVETNSTLFLKGSDNYDSLRGSGLDLLIWDEVADVKPIAFSTMSPTLADSPRHRAIYVGTPDGYNHFHDFALLGDHNNIIEKGGKNITPDSDWMTFRFTSYDNMAWPEGSEERIAFVKYLEKEKIHYYEIGQGDWFEQEYMGQFRKRAGAVHKMFDRNIHLITPCVLPTEWRRVRGYDFGSTHPTASLRVAVDNDGNWFIERCYKESKKYTTEHVKAILEQDEGDSYQGYGDPSGAQWIHEFNHLGLSVHPAKKDAKTKDVQWLQLAIDKINAKIAPIEGHTVMLPDGRKLENAPSFFILNTQENMLLVDELESLAYKESNSGLSRAEIDDSRDVKGHYDLHACLRYFAVSYEYTSSWQSTAPVITKPSRLTVMPTPEQNVVNPVLLNEEERKKAEKEADLQIIRNQLRQLPL